MEKLFETAVFTRQSMLQILKSKSYEELVKIPQGFNNSLFWNIAHLLVTQQLLFYRLSGKSLGIEPEMVVKYGKGSVATEKVSKDDIDYVMNLLVSAMEKTREDYFKGVFDQVETYKTSTGIELRNIEDVISFSTFHDGIHLGIVLAILKVI
ncbi:DinB family protein [Lutimonas saemankumensis]|uniref:DinB family protein n=1 Tax=Lutimonas saemankumensis TaxID=483016 RepID=UPI001CD2DDFD|nr:DinB family protein [Lutimonas saemankumensis]MCA0932901.1 DinB family protein [Lutimonas saemankumensis]